MAKKSSSPMQSQDKFWAIFTFVYLVALCLFSLYQIQTRWNVVDKTNLSNGQKNVSTVQSTDSSSINQLVEKDSLSASSDINNVPVDSLNIMKSQEQDNSAGVDFLIVIFYTGVLGSLLHGLQSIAAFIGNKQFYAQWTIWYLIRPFVGGILAYIFYIVLRGGLISPSTADLSQLNTYGFLAIAILSGMFSDLAVQKLKSIYKTAFGMDDNGDSRKDSLSSEDSADNDAQEDNQDAEPKQ